MNGLGSNTCIQDAANLAWKVALVEKGTISYLDKHQL
jgi:2-polyprenyl-6-methoxyphenol hydroxylase-like FAD-dependent oxidoreductase